MKERQKRSCSALKEVTDVLNRNLASVHTHTYTHAHTDTHALLPLRFNTGADASE